MSKKKKTIKEVRRLSRSGHTIGKSDVEEKRQQMIARIAKKEGRARSKG